MRKKDTLSKRILKVFRTDPRAEYNAITIDRILCKQIHYKRKERIKQVLLIRKELWRMTKRGLLLNPVKGVYSLRISRKTLHLLDNPPTVAHGIKLEATVLQNGRYHNSIQGITFIDTKKWLELNVFTPTTNNRWVKRIFWEGRFITITIHPNCGLIEIWVKCSENPLEYHHMYRLNEYLKGFLSGISDFTDVKVREIGINKDFRELRLEGVSSVMLKSFMNAWSRIYYKETIGAVRVETHWTGTIDFQDVILLIAKVNALPEKQKKDDKWDDAVMYG
jgi:hypothetical protein